VCVAARGGGGGGDASPKRNCYNSQRIEWSLGLVSMRCADDVCRSLCSMGGTWLMNTRWRQRHSCVRLHGSSLDRRSCAGLLHDGQAETNRRDGPKHGLEGGAGAGAGFSSFRKHSCVARAATTACAAAAFRAPQPQPVPPPACPALDLCELISKGILSRAGTGLTSHPWRAAASHALPVR
jgi:hypothetical protein